MSFCIKTQSKQNYQILGFSLFFNFRETYESNFLLNCQVIQALLGPKSMDFKDIYKQAHERISSLIYEQFTIIDL